MQTKKKPIYPSIGISAALLPIESGPFMGRERVAVGQDYIKAIIQAGGLPFVLPVIEEEDKIFRQMEQLDGLLLSGGFDVNPLLYREEPSRGLEAVCPERDAFEIALVQAARSLQKPLFGICRGQQLLNVALGGTLYQDLPSSLPSVFQHSQKRNPDEASHTVEVVAGTKLHHIFGSEKLFTNTYHHQAIKNLAPGLIVNAKSQDGVIEGIEGAEDHFVLGVQWHPELMVEKHPMMLKLFHAFIEAASKERIV